MSDQKHFVWGPSQQEAFVNLKQKLINAPMLHHSDLIITFCLATDTLSRVPSPSFQSTEQQ